MSIALLSIVAGVYGVSSTTEVTIIVFVPDKFFQEINFFINDTSRIDFDISRKPPNTAVHLFGKLFICKTYLNKITSC